MSASARKRTAAHGDARIAGARHYDANRMYPSLLYAQTTRRPYPSLLGCMQRPWVGTHIEARIAQLGPAERSSPADRCHRRLCKLRDPSRAQAGKLSGGSRKVPHASCRMEVSGLEVSGRKVPRPEHAPAAAPSARFGEEYSRGIGPRAPRA